MVKVVLPHPEEVAATKKRCSILVDILFSAKIKRI
jgi:hypothetical protein